MQLNDTSSEQLRLIGTNEWGQWKQNTQKNQTKSKIISRGMRN